MLISRHSPRSAAAGRAGGAAVSPTRAVRQADTPWTLALVCLLGWAATTNYTNHAALMPVLMARLDFGPTRAGLLSTAFFVTLALAFVPAGILSDRLGPKRVGAAGLLVTLASNLALGAARHFPDLLLIKLAGGAGCGTAFIAGMRYVTLAVPPARVHRALGFYGGFAQLGGGTALYLLPVLYRAVGWRWAFVASAGAVALPLAAWTALVPAVPSRLETSRFSEAARSAGVWVLGLVHGATFGLSILAGIWVTTYLVHDLGLPLVSAGAAGSALLAAGVVSRPLGGILVDRRLLAPRAAMRASMLAGVVGLAALAAPGRPPAVAAAAILALGFALSLPYAAVMSTAAARLPQAPGAAMGMVSSLSLLLAAAGAPVVGALYGWSGGFSLPFALLAAFGLLAAGALRYT